VKELCTLLGLGGIDQRAAQAAAWHLANDMTWDQLAAKQIEHLNGQNEPYFSSEQLRGAASLVDAAVQRAAERQTQTATASASAK
jgi:hypothetical protein